MAETKREVSGMNILPKYAAVELVCFGSECLSRIKKPGAEFIRYDNFNWKKVTLYLVIIAA